MAATEMVVDRVLCAGNSNAIKDDCKTIGDLLGQTETFRRLCDTFRCIEIAQQEMDRAIDIHSDKKQVINESLMALLPGNLSSVADAMYRSHCRELLERIVHGQDARPGTHAEALYALSYTSLKAPLTTKAVALFEKLFTEIFGKKAAAKACGRERTGAGQWTQECDEMLAELKQHLARDRVKNDKPKVVYT
jgi:hypothetical protein